MADVSWWLMVLAFVLGVVLTWALMVRRVTTEEPASVSPGGATGFTGGRSGAESEEPTIIADESATPKAPDDGQ